MNECFSADLLAKQVIQKFGICVVLQLLTQGCLAWQIHLNWSV